MSPSSDKLTAKEQSRGVTAHRLAEIAADLCLTDAKIHHPSSAIVRTWQWQGEWFFEWSGISAVDMPHKWEGLIALVDGKPKLFSITNVTPTENGIKGRLMPTTGKDFIIHHWMEANLPAKSDVELRLKISCLNAALEGTELLDVTKEFIKN